MMASLETSAATRRPIISRAGLWAWLKDLAHAVMLSYFSGAQPWPVQVLKAGA